MSIGAQSCSCPVGHWRPRANGHDASSGLDSDPAQRGAGALRRAAHPTALLVDAMPRHYHTTPYATVVLSGSYEEAGDTGRYRVGPGDVLIHGPFSAHQDRIGRSESGVLDLPLPFDGRSWMGLASVPDPDAIVRAAARDVGDAVELLIASLMPKVPLSRDLPDLLAEALSDDPGLAITTWAEQRCQRREVVSRQFRRVYGVDAATYRWEARTRTAWRLIVASAVPLAEVAAISGFADQAHMTRAVRRLTGETPARWRRRPMPVTSVQEGEITER